MPLDDHPLPKLQQHPLSSSMEAIRAAELAIKLERLIMGQASKRTAVTAEETVWREMSRWLVGKDEEEDLRASSGGDVGAGGRMGGRRGCAFSVPVAG